MYLRKEKSTDQKLKRPLFFLLICGTLAVLLLAGCRSTRDDRIPARIPSTLLILDDLDAQERIMRIFAKAHPAKINDVQFIDGDWSMLVNGERFFFANGRFLPEDLRGQWQEFAPYDFYDYPWVGTDRERRAAFNNPVRSVGSAFLFDSLYFSPTEEASREQQENIVFLGVGLLVNRHIAPLLDRVQASIIAIAETDAEVREWMSDLRGYGWYWRNIAGTNRRSLHSYGIAIDLLPTDLQGRQSYWQWDARRNRRINFDNYYRPPQAVVRAFEFYGFLWGGNWSLIDTMHFEYRPEILLLNKFVIEHLNQKSIARQYPQKPILAD